MPIRGETIGTAFVRILASGEGLDESIERQLREHEGAFRTQGARDSDEYNEAFRRAQERQPFWSDLIDSMDKAIAENDSTIDFFNSPTWKNFQRDVERKAGPDIGRRMIIGIENEFRRSGSTKGIIETIENDFVPRMAKATEEIVDQDKEFERQHRETLRQIDSDTSRIFANIDRTLTQHRSSLDRLGDTYTRAFTGLHRGWDGFERDLVDARNNLKVFDRTSSSAFRRLANDFDKFAEPVGRLLGRGSRNNFLNFFGSVITNSLKFGQIVADVFDNVVSAVKLGVSQVGGFLSDLRKNFAETGNAFEAFVATISTGAGEGIFSTIATGGLNLALALVAVAGAFGLAALSAGALVSALLLLGGIVIALAGSIEFALIGAIAAIGPVIVAALPIILTFIALLKEWRKKSGEFAGAVAQFKKVGRNLFDEFKSQAFKRGPFIMGQINKELKDMEPLLDAAGKGVNRLLGDFVDTLRSPAFQEFQNRFTRFLPQATNQLGIAFNNTFRGLTGLLIASIPIANRLLQNLVDITDRFARFANTPSGRKDIRQFLREAADSAAAIGDFLGSAISLLQTLLSGGKTSGDNIFTDMAHGLDRANQFLKDNPDALSNFFKDAEHFARSLGTAIDDVVSAIDEIDSPETRRAAGALIEILGKVIKIAGDIIHVFQLVANAIGTAFKTAVDLIANLAEVALLALAQVAHGIGLLAIAIPGPTGAALRAATGAFEKFANNAISDIEGVKNNVDHLGQTIEKTPTMDIDTQPALSKLNILEAVANHVKAVIASANASHVSPVQVENSGGGGGGDTGPVQPHGNRTAATNQKSQVIINVSTPTTDPRAVANETINRLVALGY